MPTLTIAQLRTAHAVAQTLLQDPRPLPLGWSPKTVRAFAGEISGEVYPATKKGLQRAAAHIERALELGLAAIAENR